MVRLLESHGEQVLRLPPGARLLGGSYTAPHELFLAGEHGNLLCCQAHVEFDVGHLRERIEPALVAKSRLNAAQRRKSVESMVAQPLHSTSVRAIYRQFLLTGHVGREALAKRE